MKQIDNIQQEKFSQVSFEQINDIVTADYMDEGIAFKTDIGELISCDEPVKINMYIVLGCVSGKLQVELNTVTYVILPGEVLVCHPGDIAANILRSPGFNCIVLCLTQGGLLEQFSATELWDKAFNLTRDPVIRLGKESLEIFQYYGLLINAKKKTPQAPYYSEIINSLIKCTLYEILANVQDEHTPKLGFGRQREALFRRFIEILAGTPVKPRTVKWYADQLCVTPKYLSTVSKEVSGKTAFEWINEYVAKDIRRLLKHSDKTIKEVAHLLQFPNTSFFGKFCRAHFGQPPTEFRKTLRQK